MRTLVAPRDEVIEELGIAPAEMNVPVAGNGGR
jgi:hypothetical protein